MTISDDERLYSEAMSFWSTQGDQTKLAVLEDLKDHAWDIGYMVERYGRMYEPIPTAFLKTEYRRLTLSPARLDHELHRSLDATPLKNTLRRLSEQCSVQEALAELIDNIFDNFARKREELDQDELRISVYFIPGVGEGYEEIILQENSGGIEADELSPLVRLGETATGDAATIGAWGQGSKIACFALADETEVFTCAPSKEPVCVHFPYGWLKEEHALYMNWDVNVYPAERISEGQTIFRFRRLRPQARDADIVRIGRHLEKAYSYKLKTLRDSGTTVSVVLEDLAGDVRHELQPTFTLEQLEAGRGFVWPPDYSPVTVQHKFLYPGDMIESCGSGIS